MIHLQPDDDFGACCWAATITAAIIAAGAATAGAEVAAHGSQSAAETNAAAATKAAGLQTTAASHAADVQAQSQAEALAFQRQQAQYTATASEADRKANYDQWAARQSQLGSVGAALGLPNRPIPAYVPSPQANYLGGAPTGQPGAITPGMPGAPQATPQSSAPAGDPSQMFLSSMSKHGLDPVAMQGHGAQIAAAVNADYPGLGVTVDPKTDAIIWPGIGPVDVTIDCGKGGWAFQPNSANAPASAKTAAQTSGGPLGTPYGGTIADYLQALPTTNTLPMPKPPPVYGGAVSAYL